MKIKRNELKARRVQRHNMHSFMKDLGDRISLLEVRLNNPNNSIDDNSALKFKIANLRKARVELNKGYKK